MRSILGRFSRVVALLGAAGCSGNVSDPANASDPLNASDPGLDQGGEDISTTPCKKSCNSPETACAAKCWDDTCNASCIAAWTGCVAECTRADAGGAPPALGPQ
jgi:hypothetical protein